MLIARTLSTICFADGVVLGYILSAGCVNKNKQTKIVYCMEDDLAQDQDLQHQLTQLPQPWQTAVFKQKAVQLQPMQAYRAYRAEPPRLSTVLEGNWAVQIKHNTIGRTTTSTSTKTPTPEKKRIIHSHRSGVPNPSCKR